MSAVNALSSINFDENHTYRTLYNASVDPDCRVRVQFCKATPEFMIKLVQPFGCTHNLYVQA